MVTTKGPRTAGTVSPRGAPVDPVDVAVALSGAALGTVVGVTRRVGTVVAPVAGALLRSVPVPERLHDRGRLDAIGRRLERLGLQGEAVRRALRDELSRRLDVLVPVVLDEVLRRGDLTGLVVRHVDLDRAVATVDLDAAAARLDVSAFLDRVDLTAVVLERVDLDAVVRAVLDRLDLVALTEEVIDGVDLPEIIRASTGSMASDTVQGVRLQSIAADEVVGRALDRLLLRHGRDAGHPTSPSGTGADPADRPEARTPGPG